MRRIPFAPSDTDAVVAFCDANGGIHDARLLLSLTSDPSGVFVVADGAGIAMVATVIDRTRNVAESANLEMLGLRTRLPPAAYVDLVIEPARAFVHAGARRALHVVLTPSLLPADGADEALRAAGFSLAYEVFEMRRPASAASVELAPLPPGWSWTDLDASRADVAHAALAEMFEDAIATQLIPLGDFQKGVASGAVSWRVLQDGDRIAGLVRAVPHRDHGELRILGRVPSYRGRGLGPRLVAEGLRLLRQTGDVELSVEAANDRALGLYRRFGFEVVARTPVFGLKMR
jgi:ribosomal protein S18 acetylase RimI-like enzyme